MKIVMVGPVYPYKGGIAHYTGAMCRSLRKEHDVVMLSYKMQYPSILFKQEQKDYGNDTFAVEGTQYLIHTASPANWLTVARWINKQKADAIIFQWWHPYFAPCYRTIIQYLRNIPAILLCHNVLPHERFPGCKILSKAVLRSGNGYIVHSEQDAQDLLSIVKYAHYEKAVLPTYNAFKFLEMSKEEARAKLGMAKEDKILLFFGFVREYKGLQHIISAMPKIAHHLRNCKLYIVGEFREGKEPYLKSIEETGVSGTIVVHDEYVPDQEIEPFFAASDLVVLPYESATQSGIVQIAYGFEKPVIATAVGGLPEVVLDGKTGYVVPPKNPDALADAVIRFFTEDKAEEFAAAVRGESDKYSWDRMNETVAKLLEKVYAHEK